MKAHGLYKAGRQGIQGFPALVLAISSGYRLWLARSKVKVARPALYLIIWITWTYACLRVERKCIMSWCIYIIILRKVRSRLSAEGKDGETWLKEGEEGSVFFIFFILRELDSLFCLLYLFFYYFISPGKIERELYEGGLDIRLG